MEVIKVNPRSTEVEVINVNHQPVNDELPGVQVLLHRSSELVITDQESLEESASIAKLIKERIKILKGACKTITDPLDIARKSAMDLVRQPIALLESELLRQNSKTVNFMAEQERIRRLEEEKIRAAAARKEEAAREKAENARKEAEEARKAGDEAEASKLESKAEKAEMRADNVVVEAVAPKFSRVPGVSIRSNWKARSIPGKEHLIPRTYMMLDQKKADKFAKAMQNTMEVPGLEFYNEAGIARRS